MPANTSRRDFLKNSTALLGIAFAGFPVHLNKELPLLSFSTLGCPDWSFPDIVKFAAANGYSGLELRGVLRQLDLVQCPEFSNPLKIASSLSMMQSNGLKFVDLGSSCELHHSAIAERQKNLDDGKKFIDLARQLQCPNVRVFPNDLPKDQDRNATIDLIVSGLLELGDYAKGSSVSVLMESHGALVYSDDLAHIMKAAEHPNVGLVWDVVNMWSITREPPQTVYDKLKKYIRHAHIKDANIVNGKDEYVLLGKGQTPIFEGIDALYNGGYKGYYSFEWEKLWHPEIAASGNSHCGLPLGYEKTFPGMIC